MGPFDLSRKDLYEKCKPLVWKIKYHLSKEGKEAYGKTSMMHSGFVIRDGYIATVLHSLPLPDEIEEIKTFPITSPDTLLVGRVVLRLDRLNVGILEISPSKKGVTYGHVSLPKDMSLLLGQPLMNISVSGTMFFGAVMFRCSGQMSRYNEDICKYHQPKQVFQKKPVHRSLGLICNKSTCDFVVQEQQHTQYSDEDSDEEEDSDEDDDSDEEDIQGTFKKKEEDIQDYINDMVSHFPHGIPLIHLNGIHCYMGEEDEGSPLFNCSGDVVGMMCFDFDTLSKDGFALHPSILGEALAEIQAYREKLPRKGKKMRKRKSDEPTP